MIRCVRYYIFLQWTEALIFALAASARECY
jgi:hypothetical protein